MTKVLLIGAGGIGSWFAEFFTKAKLAGQIPVTTSLAVADFDAVEIKNVGFQNYTSKQIGVNKAQALAARLPITAVAKRITTEKELESYDTIILAVDNSDVRRLVFKHCWDHAKEWIDLRCNERNIGCYTVSKGNTPEVMEKTLGPGGEAASCQRDVDIRDNKLSYACLVIAAIGLQQFLNMERNEVYADTMVKRI